MCDVPFHDNSPPLDVSKDQFKDFSDSNDEFSLTDDDSFSIDKIDYIEASPPDSELVSSEVMEIVIPEVGGIDDDILLTIKDNILREKLLNVNHLFAKIEASNDNPTPFYNLIISGTPLNLTLSGESDFFLEFTTFSSVLFDAEYESDSSDDQSCSNEDVLEKIISKPLIEEGIIPMKINLHPYNAESDLMESLRTHDSSLPILSKIDSLLDEFAGELTLLKSILPGIDETDCDFEEDIRLIEKLFDSLMKEIDLFCTPDYSMPPGIEDDDYDSERDILIRKDLPSNNTLSFAEKESVHFDIPSFSRPSTKPPDGDTGILNIEMMGDISNQKAFMHKLMITLASHHEKSPDLLSHRGLKAFQPFAKCTMMIHGQNNPILDVKENQEKDKIRSKPDKNGKRTLPSKTITNTKEDLKGVTTRSGIAYKGPTIHTTSSSPKVVEPKTEVTKDTVPPTNNECTKDVQPLAVQVETQVPNSEPVVARVVEPVEAPLPEKLRDPSKFLIPCDFLGMDECLALADLGASINLMPLSVWSKFSLPELSPTCMTLELAERLISHPVGVAEDVFIKVGKFHFPADFVVVDFDADPRAPLILKRSFLKTGRALIDVYEGELTLCVGNKAVTFNLDQTSRYSANYDAESINRIDVINVACEEYSQEVLGFFVSGNPTPSTEPIVSTSYPTLTPFGDSDFLLEETDAFLDIKDEPISSKINYSYYDSKGDILLLE
nr:reverse transcriptase domain-containing protein [Tanacetum cinerariifolium]